MNTTYKGILNLKYNLAPSQLDIFDVPNKNTMPVKDLLDRNLNPSDRGKEIGSVNYISSQSNYYFIRTKALQKEHFSPFLNDKTTTAIRPQVFKNFNLKKGDLIISGDSKIGETVILDKDYPNFTMSGALYKLPVTKNKFYLFAFLKHHYFREQLNLLVPKGSTMRHAKKMFLDCKVPFPSQKNANEIIKYVELLVQAIINKEKEITRKNKFVFELIEKELLENQKNTEFKYKNPTFDKLFSNLRIDSGYYCREYKQRQWLIHNYIWGAESINGWGFEIKRGQNLQISQIGKSIYSSKPKKNFYTLINPTNFTEFGTVEKFEYLGNPKKLSLLEAGDIAFSAEGTIGKCILFDEPKEKWITNIHGIVLSKKDHNIKENAFISCFLRFLRYWGTLDYISVGGQGGSLAQKYWKDVVIPKFPKLKQEEIASLYHNLTNYPTNLSLDNFLSNDQKWNQKAGIIEIDKSIKIIKDHLNKTLDKIVNDEEEKIDFSF